MMHQLVTETCTNGRNPIPVEESECVGYRPLLVLMLLGRVHNVNKSASNGGVNNNTLGLCKGHAHESV